MKVHYLEIVSLDADAVYKVYEVAHNISFGEADESLGGARTCTLSDGCIVGVRGPLRETETPVVRPYWLVEDIETAIANVEMQGAKIPGKGKFAIYLLEQISDKC